MVPSIDLLVQMVDYSRPRVRYEKIVQNIDFLIFFEIFISIQGVQGAIWEGPEPIPVLKHIKNKSFSKNWKKLYIYINTRPKLKRFLLDPLFEKKTKYQ